MPTRRSIFGFLSTAVGTLAVTSTRAKAIAGNQAEILPVAFSAVTKLLATNNQIPVSVQVITTLGYSRPGFGGARYVADQNVGRGKPLPQSVIKTEAGASFEILSEDVNSAAFGAIGDGKADDTISLQALFDYCAENSITATILPGRYRHTGLKLHSRLRVEGAGRAVCLLLNTGINDSLALDRKGISVAEEWSLTGLTLRAEADCPSAEQRPRRGLSFDTCRHGQVSDLRVEGHQVGIWERSSWSMSFEHIRIENCGQAWQCSAGQNTGGVPSQRRSIEIDDCDRGIGIENNGLECAVFTGGSVEGCREWGIKITGRTNRAITFISFNFEANCLGTQSADLICGDPVARGTGPSCITLIGCRFMNRSNVPTRAALALNEGSGFSLNGCHFLGYDVVAVISSHFGSFALSSNKGTKIFSAGDKVAPDVPLEGEVSGLRHSFFAK